MKHRIFSVLIILLVAFAGWFVWDTQKTNSFFVHKPFKLGLDLAGGTQLVYSADTSKLSPDTVDDAMSALRDVIERRVNLFGVAEPLVQIQHGGITSGHREERLIVELPGVTDVDAAIKQIGETPLLEFKLEKENAASSTDTTNINDLFVDTGLTGQYVASASLQFNQSSGVGNQPVVDLKFNSEGKEMFKEITSQNIGKVLAVFLDGSPISLPTIREAITDGDAVISGGFTIDQAKELARNINYGALPVPISLVNTQTVGASLGGEALNFGIKAGIIGFILVLLFLIFWYRIPGLVASLALVVYVIISLLLFKLIPITITAAGLAGFILSVGMAVDANILIFERAKEEMQRGLSVRGAFEEGFARAWPSIRDSNISSMITALILFWIGTSSVQGFALTLGIGVLVSMLTALSVSRTFLWAIVPQGIVGKFVASLFKVAFARIDNKEE